jgi:hypothetical protein
MNKTFKLLMILALGAGVFTLQSCSDETGTTDPTPAETTCYVTQEKITSDGDIQTIDYTYDSDDNIILAVSTEDGVSDSTVYEYSGGRLAIAYDGFTESTFIYPSGSNTPERINTKEDGVSVSYAILTSDGANITKIENHNTLDGDVIEDVLFVEYDANGDVTSAEGQEYNADADEFTTILKLSNVITDGKKNPYATSLAFFYQNEDNPVSLGTSNVASATITLNGFDTPYASSFEYNSDMFPTSSSATILGFGTTTDITYNCK